MAAVSVFESRHASTLGVIIGDPDEVRLIQLFREMTPEQRDAWLVLGRSIVAGNRAAPWHGYKAGRA